MHEVGQLFTQIEFWILLDIRDFISDPGSVLNRFDCRGEGTTAHSRSLKLQWIFYLQRSSSKKLPEWMKGFERAIAYKK